MTDREAPEAMSAQPAEEKSSTTSREWAIGKGLAGAGVLGLVSAFGDWLWANYLQDGDPVAGVLHGILVFVILAGVLAMSAPPGERRRAFKVLMLGLPVAGGLIAAVFYPIAYLMGYLGALLVTWALMWLVTSWLNDRSRAQREPFGLTAGRAALAAVFSGLAFWAISGVWTSPPPEGGPNYLWHFAAWSFAYLPGFLALLTARPSRESQA
ncbi:MAG: hypothetical protein AAF725_07910 [Acidobacteriota bacterium]